MAEFADEALLKVAGGHGGHGCMSIHPGKVKPLGGPDGANGGRGGDVILEVDPNVNTLLDFHRRPVRRATNGKPGEGANRTGAEGGDLIIGVPEGTVVKSADGTVLADLVGAGTRYVAAPGGKGGLGNAALASVRRKAPGFALKGEPGEEHDLLLELKSIADIGLVGFPSAGKSSLIAAMSAARPKIADYPFTTLIPNLGVAEAGDVEFVIADVPGLIPGASEGKGLGLEFLRHIERCAALVHVLDCATEEPGRDPLTDLEVIEAELAAYAELTDIDLASRPRLVALNKIDVPAARELADLVRDSIIDSGLPVYEVSAATREGLRELGFAMAEVVTAARAAGPPAEPSRTVIRPQPAAGPDFTIERTPDGGYLVRGEKTRRWVLQTDFSNDEAVGFLADRLGQEGPGGVRRGPDAPDGQPARPPRPRPPAGLAMPAPPARPAGSAEPAGP